LNLLAFRTSPRQKRWLRFAFRIAGIPRRRALESISSTWIQAFIWAFKPTDVIDIRRFPKAEAKAIEEENYRLSGKEHEDEKAAAAKAKAEAKLAAAKAKAEAEGHGGNA
jgi:hypothetical protein